MGFKEKSIPHSLHECGYGGIAQAVTFLAIQDIIRETKAKLRNGEDPYGDYQSYHYNSAVSFLMRKHNVLYTLDIPGEELIRIIKKEVINDWNRKCKQWQFHCRD